jgi:predicted nucleic acid-binding protein
VKIVLDTTILVRANEHAQGLARDLLTTIVESKHTLLLSNEMLHELARVLRYPRLRTMSILPQAAAPSDDNARADRNTCGRRTAIAAAAKKA